MKAKVTLEYDDASGQITDASGAIIGNWMGLDSFSSAGRIKIDTLVKLKEAGYTAEEIISMDKREMI